MWFGTYDGLNRYDGYDFTIFRHNRNDSTSIVNNWIGVISEDSLNRLWVGTRNGVNIYDALHANFQPVRYTPWAGGVARAIAGSINDIKTSRSGDVYIASAAQGLLLCQKGQSAATQIPLPEDNKTASTYNAAAVAFSPDGDIYVSIRSRGLFQYNKASHTLTLINSFPKNGLSLAADLKQRLWVGADDGLYQYDLVSRSIRQVYHSNNRVVQLSIRENTLWIASDGDGALSADLNTGAILPLFNAGEKSRLTSSSVYSIYHDDQQRTWIGTIRGGINIMDESKSRCLSLVHDPTHPNSLINNYILSCCEDKSGNLWIGTDGGGLSCYNRLAGSFTNYSCQSGKRSISNDFVTSLLNDDQNNTWIGTWGGGIDRFDKTTGRFAHYATSNPVTGREDKNIWCLYQDSQKDIWAGCCVDGVLYRLNKATGRLEAFDTTLRNIITLYEDKKGQLWAGDYYSLIKIDPIHKNHSRYPIGFSVRSIYEDEQHRFWIGTEGSGLLQFNRESGQYTAITEDDGLANNAVLQVIPDDQGRLWLSTFKGISVFSPSTSRIDNITQSDGLLCNQLSYHGALKMTSGELAFGGIKGMNIFHPGRIQVSDDKHPALLSNITIDNTTPDKSGAYITEDNSGISTIRLPFEKAVLSLTFVTPEYSTPDKISYAYYLEGWDKAWNFSGKNRTAAYTRLHEGTYWFKIKTANGSNNWSKTGTLVKIIVLPPWYRTWWAYSLYIILVGSIIGIGYHYRSKQIRLQYEVAFAQHEIEKEKELNEKKLSFFTDVAHEFRSPLTLIAGPMKELIQRYDKKPESNELNTVYRNARRLLSLVNQLLLFRKADTEEDSLIVQKINFHQLCQEVYCCFRQQAKFKNIRYELICSNPDLEVYGDYEKLEIILFNLISNALKYTSEGGAVSVTIEEKGPWTAVVIEDTGCGIEQGQDIFTKFYRSQKRQASSGFGIGLYLARKFTLAHKGLLTYKSQPGQGSVFCLSLPTGSEHLAAQLSENVLTEKPQLINELSKEDLVTTLTALEPTIPEEQTTVPEDFLYGRRTILIVDDDAELRQYLKQILSSGYFVQEAADGTTALDMALQNMPDLVISDIVMNETNGIELCKKIKSSPELTHIPVILLTSSSSDETKLSAIQCGADDYITKPFDKTMLLARIDNIFKSRNAIQQYFLDTITLQKQTSKVSAEYRDFLQRCIEIVEEYIDKDDFSIKLLAKEIGMSHSSLYKKIKLISGLSASSFIRFIRLRRAAVLMLTANANINEAAFRVGINDPKYFRQQFKKLFGMNPSEYIKQYRHSFISRQHTYPES